MQVLIEHQPSPDKHIAFRMISYVVATMQSHLDAGHHKLPLVIPIDAHRFYTQEGYQATHLRFTKTLDYK